MQKDTQPFTVLGFRRHAWFIAAKGNVSSGHLYLFSLNNSIYITNSATTLDSSTPVPLKTNSERCTTSSPAKGLAADIALHHIQGPRRPSWGIEMTVLASLARNLASNTHLTDVHTLRAAVSISGLMPTPSDALITDRKSTRLNSSH